MDFVENDNGPGRLVAPEELGILECTPYPDEFAVEVANPGQ
jgi:hypothetical protein